MSCQRGQGSPELHYICDNYNEAIEVYYNHHAENSDFLQSTERKYWFMYLYEFPMSTDFKEKGFSWSKVKLSKSSKYRIKFKTWGDLTNEYKITQRDKVIDEIGCVDLD